MNKVKIDIPKGNKQKKTDIAKRKKALIKTLKYNGGNVARACKIIGISRSTFDRYVSGDKDFKRKSNEAIDTFLTLSVKGVYNVLKNPKNRDHYKACERMLDAYKYKDEGLYKTNHVNSDNKNNDTVNMKVTGIKVNWCSSNEQKPEEKKN